MDERQKSIDKGLLMAAGEYHGIDFSDGEKDKCVTVLVSGSSLDSPVCTEKDKALPYV